MKNRLAVITMLLLAGCAPEPGSEAWCEAKKAQPKTDWTLEDAGLFARHCLLESETVGSEAWCRDLENKPKGEWTGDEAASYARHCVM